MKVTVKESIKGFSAKLSFGGTASDGTKKKNYSKPLKCPSRKKT